MTTHISNSAASYVPKVIVEEAPKVPSNAQQSVLLGKLALPANVIDVEVNVLGSNHQIAQTLQREWARLTPEQSTMKLLDTSNFTDTDLQTLSYAYSVTVANAAPDDVQSKQKYFDQEQPVNRLKFDPSTWSNVSALLSAIAALNLARAVGAEMQGKFAQLAYAAAIAQGKATIASGRAEMMAAISGAVVAVGLAGAGAKMALDGHKMRHADINNNLVKSNNLQNALGDAQETLAKRPERIDRSLASNRNMKSGDTVNTRPGAQSGVEAPELNPTNSTELQRGQARVDSAHQEVEASRTQVKQSEVQLKEAEAKLNAEQHQLEAANAKVQSLEQQVATADNSQKVALQTDLEQANADLGKVTEQHSQTQADVKALQSQLAQHKLDLAKAEVGLAEADVELSTANVQLAQRNVQTASSQLEAANSNAQVKDQAVAEMEAKLRTAPESDRARLNDDLVFAKNERTAAHRQKQVAETDLSSAKAELSAANAQLAQASLNLKSAETTLSSAQRSVEGLQAEDTQRRDVDDRERAALSRDNRRIQGEINDLQLKSRLRQKDIDKLLTYSQLLLASSSVMSSMVLASIRTQSFIEQSNAILRGSEAGTQNSLTRTEEQTVTEDSAEINKLLDAVKQLQQQNADVVSHVASMRS